MVDRVLSDRFWQAGISEGSKDDFYARVMDKKNTMEGLASSIRGSVRFVRETAYAIIYCMSRLDLLFYTFPNLSGTLSEAFFTDSTWLSTHQQSNLLNLVRYLVDDCPVDCREQTLPHLIAACFRQMDSKICGEWSQMDQQQGVAAEGEAALKEEMKAESILRQVTYTAVLMIADFLDPGKMSTTIPCSKWFLRVPFPLTLRTDPRVLNPESVLRDEHGEPVEFPSLRKFCLLHQEIVEPLLVFCSHGIRVRDSRCCSMILRLFISLVPEFNLEASHGPKKISAGLDSMPAHPLSDSVPIPQEIATAIREFISMEVLQACITSFHEPYFVDLQKELASLIGAVLVHYTPITATPKNVLLSLPNIQESDLDRLSPYIQKPSSHTRQQRAIVLDMLKDLKGVSVSEMGKMPKSTGFGGVQGRSKKVHRTRMAEAFMSEPTTSQDAPRTGGTHQGGRGTPDALEGVSNLFDA